MNCEACGKFFSGKVPWEQHISSDKHKKKVALMNNSVYNYPRSTGFSSVGVSDQKDELHCPACNISCASIKDFLNHSLTLEHVSNVNRRQNERGDVDSTTGIESIRENGSKIDDKLLNLSLSGCDETDKILPEPPKYGVAQVFSSTCEVCKKMFSGPEPYKQHIESAAHKKKVEFQNFVGPGAVQNGLGPLSCDVCKKMFSGNIPYDQHINSDTHKKKVQNLQFLEKMKMEGNSIPDYDSARNSSSGNTESTFHLENPFFCKLCNVPCSGEIPFRQHVSGEIHKKNLKRVQLSESTVSSSEFKPANSQFFGENHSTASSHNNHLPASDINRDYVLPELSAHLAVMNIEDLKLKTFEPEETLDLDKLQNIENKDPLKMISEYQDSSTVECDDQMENTYAYEECQCCNVKLQNKKEALAHFDSLEHVTKKWKIKGLL